MKKKHRDIVVGGKTYGWTADNWTLKIWENKKVIATHKFPESHDEITPSMVKLYIKDPATAEILHNAKPCPFCGAELELSKNDVYDNYFVCTHKNECWLAINLYTLIRKDLINIWNKRN